MEKQEVKRNYLERIKDELANRDKYIEILKKHIEVLENLPFKPGDFVFSKTHGNCLISDYFVKDEQGLISKAQDSSPNYGYFIINWEGMRELVPLNDLLPISKATQVLYE